MSAILFISCMTAFIMLIWFRTDAVTEWAGLFGLKKMCRNYKDAKIEAAPRLLTYPQYLKEKHNCFMNRLFSCPLCFCVWLVAWQCFGLALLLGNVIFAAYFPVVYVASLLIYGVIVKLYGMMP